MRAHAECVQAFLLDLVSDGNLISHHMSTVTVWLIVGQATGTPHQALTLEKCYGLWT